MEGTARNRAFVISWRDAFKIHLPEIDGEHRHLFNLVSRLELSTIAYTIDELLNYVVTHFTHEQQLMEASGFPAFDEHLKLHEQFSIAVADFLGSDEAWNEERVDQLRKFLNRWLVGHIMTHDLRFGTWYRDHGGVQRAGEPGARQAAPAATAPRRLGWFDRLLGRR